MAVRKRALALCALVVAALVILCGLPMFIIMLVLSGAPSGATCGPGLAGVTGEWANPTVGRVSNPFGNINAMYETGKHTGIDIGNDAGTPIVASAAGEVVKAGAGANGGAYGTSVLIDHGQGFSTLYAHLEHLEVTAGDTVAAGTQIGAMGNTGQTSGGYVHLHFEVLVPEGYPGASPVNPIASGFGVDPVAFLRTKGIELGGPQQTEGSPLDALPPPGSDVITGGPTTPFTGRFTDDLARSHELTLSPEQVAVAREIANVGHQLGVSENGVVIALMAGLVESKLQNLPYGDRDSLGVFQQRANWGSAEERQTVIYAAKAFFGGDSGPNAGNPPGLLDTPGWESMAKGDAAQAVQASGYPDRYAGFESYAQDLLVHIGVPVCGDGSAPSGGPKTAGQIAVIKDTQIEESSGLAIATQDPNLVYTVVDEGSRFFGIDLSSGRTVGQYNIPGMPNDMDTESIREDRKGQLWVADTGDNDARRRSVALYAVTEPGPGDKAVAATKYPISYRDGPVNVEALAINPRTGDKFLITKNESGPGTVLALPNPLVANQPNVATDLGHAMPPMVSDASFTVDGARVLVRTTDGGLFVYDPNSWQQVGKIDVQPAGEKNESLTVEDANWFLYGAEGKNSPIVRGQNSAGR